MAKKILEQKVYSSTHPSVLGKLQINYVYWTDVSFMEKLKFLFGKKKIYVHNEISIKDNVMTIDNHIKFLNLGA